MQSRFGGAGETSVHPVVAGAMLLIAVLIFVLPRRQVIVPFLAAAFLIPMDQVILIGAFHFQMLRLLILFGWIRLIRDKFSSDCTILSHGANWIDRTVGLWVISGAITFVLLWQESGAIINQLGTIYTAFGIYFLLRFLIRDTEDAKRAIRAFAYIAAVVAVIMSIEQATGRNPYAVIGGSRVADRQMLMEREDRFRAEASFGHPILAGTFGGISLPLYLALSWKDKQSRKALLVGVMATTVIVLASNSSTSMLAYGAGLLALGLWPVRRWMRAIRWGLLATLVTLHLTMKAPVWALIARIDLTGGSSSYHRYQLVDLFIRRFWDWWLIGVKNNADWGWMMWDLANQYVSIGQTSGLLPFICFLATIVYGFKYVGRARKAAAGNKRQEWFIWALSAALFANVVAFFGISYFDQTIVAWYALLAMISVAGVLPRKPRPVLLNLNTAPDSANDLVIAGHQATYRS